MHEKAIEIGKAKAMSRQSRNDRGTSMHKIGNGEEICFSFKLQSV